jgi:hypothetical protein
MAHNQLLVVEGVDDLHAVRNLVYQYNVEVYYAADETGPDVGECDFEIRHAGGRDRLGAAIGDALRLGNVSTLGVVADADQDHEAQWRSVTNHLFQHTSGRPYTSKDDLEVEDGWIAESVDVAEESVRVGAWLMPDNVSDGALEDFAANLVPTGDRLWAYAETVIDDLPRRPFKPTHTAKARLHTYLAWQDPPREPIGRAISHGPLIAQSPLADQFVTWIRQLFQVDNPTRKT